MPQEGIYHATVAPQGRVTEASTGSGQVEVDCTATHLWNAIIPNDQGGKGAWQSLPNPIQLILYLSMADAAAQYTVDKLKELGFNGDFQAPQFSNKTAKLQCRHDTWQGKERTRWELYWRGASKPAKAATVTRLNAMWQSMAAEPSAGSGPSEPPAAPMDTSPIPPPQDLPEDGTPF